MKTQCKLPSGQKADSTHRDNMTIPAKPTSLDEAGTPSEYLQNPVEISSFMEGKGYDEYKDQVNAANAQRADYGRESIEDEAHRKMYERFYDNEGELKKDKLGDIVFGLLPKADNMNVQAKIASELTHRTILSDPNISYEPRDQYVYYVGDLEDARPKEETLKQIKLPSTHPRKTSYTTTEKYIVDKTGNKLAGLDYQNTSYATQMSRMTAQEPFTTFMDQDMAVEYNEMQAKYLAQDNAWDNLLDEADLIYVRDMTETELDSQKASKEEKAETVVEVFDKIKKGSNYYFQLFHDWRGRYYYKTRFFNPQGVSFEKASVALVWDTHFQDGSKEHDWFKVHMANVAGKDKGQYSSYPARRDWFDTNINSLDDIEKHFDEEDWPQAKMHYQMYLDGDRGNIPLAMDSTTSGYQLISLMMGDQSGLGDLTNISGNPKDKRDLYTAAAEATLKRLNIKEDAFALRKVFKNPTMLIIYDASPTKTIAPKVAQNYIEYKVKEHFKDVPSKEELLQFIKDTNLVEKANKIGNEFIQVLGAHGDKPDPQFATASKFKKALKDAYLANPDSSSEASWTFPDGQTVTFHPFDKDAYKTMEDGKSPGLYDSQQVSNIGDEKYTYNARTFERTRKRDKKKAPRPLMANFVQSVDAYLANYVGVKMHEAGYPFIGIHDSFATTAEGVEFMQQQYLAGMASLVTPSQETGLSFFESAIKDISGNKHSFKQGEIDFHKLASSKYALS